MDRGDVKHPKLELSGPTSGRGTQNGDGKLLESYLGEEYA